MRLEGCYTACVCVALIVAFYFLLFLRTVQDWTRQRYTLWALLCQRGFQQLPPRHSLQAFWPFNESEEHVCRNVWNDYQHYCTAVAPSGDIFTVFAQLQVRLKLSLFWTWSFTLYSGVLNVISWFLGRSAYCRTGECISQWFTLDRRVCRRWSHLWKKFQGLFFLKITVFLTYMFKLCW